jgi:uncharacterized RDD family membrane protein YckC
MSGAAAARNPATAAQGQAAGLISRCIASVVDLLVVVAVVLAGYLVFALVLLVSRPRRFAWPATAPGLLAWLGCVVAVLYLGAFWSGTGRTIGDQLMGLRVRTRQGRRLRPSRALLRALLCVVFPLGLLWSAVSRARRSVQDLVVGSEVVYEWGPRAPRRQTLPAQATTGGPAAPGSYRSNSKSPS